MGKLLLALLTAWTVALVASPAQSQTARDVYAGGKPLTAADLPAGRLRSRLESLVPAARDSALRQLNQLNVPAADLDHIAIDDAGAILYIDPPAPGRTDAQGIEEPDSRAIKGMTLAKVFTLHSRPTAKTKVYLNFRGWTISGTAWNQGSGFAVHEMLPYSKDADRSTFSQDEVNEIAEVWRAMSEDLAPFDIDVTTQQPASFGPNVGHVLFSPKTDKAGNKIITAEAGGVAFLDVWGRPEFVRHQPALVFPEGTGTVAKGLVEAATHELGHNLGLTHDGTSTVGYYTGHGTGKTSWAPIMGVGYYANVSQWSKGEYPDANNKQDDMAVIASKLRYRADDHANTIARATKLSVVAGKVTSLSPVEAPAIYSKVNRGVIHSRTDIDLFWFQTSGGRVAFTVRPAWIDSFKRITLRTENLNVKITLLNASGAPIASSLNSKDTLATLARTLARGKYYLKVEGIGSDTLATGFSDYGSVGQYFIDGTVPGG